MAVVNVNRNIPQSAFKDMKTITSVFFGNECSSVGIDAFNGCISLSEINSDNGIIEIGHGTFANTPLYAVKLNKLNKIGSIEEQNVNGAFQYCSILTSISIQQCSIIGNNTFYSCTKLKTVNINSKSANVKIGNNAFCGCENLSDIYFKSCVAIGNNAFESCKSLENANLKNCYDEIGQNAFCGCENLKEITLPYCKYGIGDSAFYNCNNLSRVYINTSSAIPLGKSVFYSGSSIIKNIKFFIPFDTKSNFTNDENWKEYENHMVETPKSNQIMYATNSGNPIDEKHTLENGFRKITFGEDVVQLSSKIFKDNEDLTFIYSPYKLETVGEQEFEGCINLDKFIPPQNNTLTTIGDYAFKNCTSLKSFEIPESLTSIGEGVFAGCSNIEKFEGNVEYVKYNNKAIVYDDTLISVAQKDNSETGGRYYKISNIDSNIKNLGKYCFYGFKELIRVVIPSNIYRIGENAFDGCDNLQEVHFDGDPSNINFEKNAFGIFVDENENEIKNGREDFKIFIPERIFKNINFESEENASIKKYEKYIYPEPAEKQIIIYYLNNSNDSDSDSNNKNYKTIKFSNDLSFEGNEEISKVIFGEKITKINDYAFKNCTSLEYIYLPDTINTFGNECFYGCSCLKRIYIPNNINKINKDTFKGCTNLKGISLPQNLKIIGESAFEGCINLEGISLPQNLKIIGGSAFKGCINMCIDTNLSNVEEIGEFAFNGCTELKTSFVLSSTLTSIGIYCFSESGITELDMSNAYKINIIPQNAFSNCANLTNVKLPDSIDYIQYDAFENCEKIKEINLPLNLSKMGGNSFATNGPINIYINNIETPPKFVNKNGKEDETIYPFGNPEKTTDLNGLKIFVSSLELLNTYIFDTHWNKYSKYISLKKNQHVSIK